MCSSDLDVEHWLVGQEVEVGDQFFIFLFQFHGAGAQSLFEHRFVLQKQLHGTFRIFIAARSGLFLRLGKPVLDGFQIFKLQFRVDNTLVADGIDVSVDVGDVVIVETAKYVNDGVRIADVSEKFVAQAFSFRGSFDQSGNIDDFDGGRNYTFGIVYFGQLHQSLVGYGDDTYVGFDGAEREVGCLCFCVGEAVEKRRLPHVGKSYDAAL